jgi:hypothetical protein
MAKGKHSPALFEVVHGKKHFDKPETVLRTPTWWFKGRHRGPAMPAVEPSPPPGLSDEFDPTQPKLPQPAAVPAPIPEPAEYESAEDPTINIPPPKKAVPFQFVVDRDRQELFLRVRFTTAIVAGFALIVVIALAYVTGRQSGRGPSTALATQSSREVAAGPVEKGVLDLPARGGLGGAAPAGATVGAGGVSAQPAPSRITEASVAPPGNSPAGRQVEPPAPLKPDLQDGRRIVGKQYVVIQSYPADQKKLADQACEFLVTNGVSCTVERGLPGWAGWNTVVGTQAFDRASGSQYEAYVATIVRLGEKFAGKSAWKRFEPTAVRWKETS